MLDATVVSRSAGQAERRTHDDKRHGPTSLFAALDIATDPRSGGKMIGPWVKRRRAKECLTVLREIDAKLSEDLEVHLIMDDDATHKTPAL